MARRRSPRLQGQHGPCPALLPVARRRGLQTDFWANNTNPAGEAIIRVSTAVGEAQLAQSIQDHTRAFAFAKNHSLHFEVPHARVIASRENRQ